MMKDNSEHSSNPLYQQVKSYITDRINRGSLQAGMRIESESELVTALQVSRMTVNRALRELTAEGWLTRRQGRGTFVAHRKVESPLIEIRSIADEIKARGGIYSCTVHLLQEEKANPQLAKEMGLAAYSTVFHAIVVHKDSDLPIQIGYRHVNPIIAPHFLEQDFTSTTVSEYLLGLAPVSRMEHIVEACIPEQWIRDLLQINSAEPCLALHRKTWVNDTVATKSTFYSPGSRYRLAGTFHPSSGMNLGIT